MNHLKLSTLAIAIVCSVGISHAESGADTTMPNEEYSLNAKDKSQFFTLDQGENIKTDVRAAYLKNDPRAEQAWIIHINANLISENTQKITLPLQDGNTITFYLSDFSKDKNNISVWSGGYLPKADKERFGEHGTVALENNAIFVKNGSNITGSFVVDGEQYNIDPLGNGEHALIKVDSSFPSEDDTLPVLAQTPFNYPETFTTITAHSNVRVLVVTTDIARQNVVDMDGLVAQMFKEANQANEDSHVDITFENAGIFHADYQDNGVPRDSLFAAHNPETPLGAQVAKAREQRKADLVVILGSNANNTSICGVGALNAIKEDAFSAVSYTCAARSTYSFHHEMGHNFGLKHNWGGDDANPDIIVPDYAYGYSLPGVFRTVMSYQMNREKKINYWSNPAISYNGTSQMIGDEHADAARLLNERREYVANFYPPMGDEIMQAPVITLDRPEITAVKSGNQYTSYGVTASGNQEGLGWNWERVEGDENITLESGKLSNKAQVIVPKGLTGVTAKFRARGTNMDKQTGEAIVTVNVVDPAVEISGPASMDTAAPVKLEAKANFNEPTYKWELRQGEQVIAGGIDRSGQIKAGLEAGHYTVNVTATREVMDQEATSAHTIEITKEAAVAAPVVTLNRAEINVVSTSNSGFGYQVKAHGDQDNLSWKWERIEGNQAIYPKSTTAGTTEIVVPKNVTDTKATFRVRGTNPTGQSGEAIVNVNVVSPSVVITGAGSMDAAAAVKLDAVANFDQVNYQWTLKQGTQTIANGIDQNGQVKAGLAAGDYAVVVTASSAHGARSATATHALTITSQVQNNDQAFIDGLKLGLQFKDNGSSYTITGDVMSSTAATSVAGYTWALPEGAQGSNTGKAKQSFTVAKTTHPQAMNVSVLVTAGKASGSLADDFIVPAVADATGYPDWAYGRIYKTGDVVKHKDKLFECVIAGWCSQIGQWSQLHYEPEVGLNWTLAWKYHNK